MKLLQSETLLGNITVNALILATTGAVVLGGNNLHLGSGAFLNTANTGSGNLAGGTLTFGGNDGVLISRFGLDTANNPISVTTLATSIAGGASLTIAGNTTIPDANTYTGSTTLNSGRLTLGHNSSLGTTGALNIVGGALISTVSLTLNKPFSLNNSVLLFDGSNSITFSGNGTVSSPGSPSRFFTNLLINSNNGQTNMFGTLAGAGHISVRGDRAPSPTASSNPGNLYLTGNNSALLGGFTLQPGGADTGGGVVVGHNSALGAGILTLAGGRLFADASAQLLATRSFSARRGISLEAPRAEAARRTAALRLPGTARSGSATSCTRPMAAISMLVLRLP